MKKKLLIVVLTVLASLMAILIWGLKTERLSLQGNTQYSGTILSLLNQARDLEAKNKLFEAKGIYQRLIAEFPSSPDVMNWQKKSEDINIRLLFSPVITAGSTLYEIRPADTLTKIANTFKTTTELIMKSNGLTESKIIPGRKIKVRTVPFTILVDKSQNILILKSGEEIIKTYIVSTGANNSTPVGNLKITNKLVNPTWFKAGAVIPAGSPENILGTRWMGFDLAEYGIHGTTEPQSLGRQVTQGCVRMSNTDVEELYSIIPVGTEVTIVD